MRDLINFNERRRPMEYLVEVMVPEVEIMPLCVVDRDNPGGGACRHFQACSGGVFCSCFGANDFFCASN